MREDTTIPFRNPAFRDELSERVRGDAQRIIHPSREVLTGVGPVRAGASARSCCRRI
ncbi:MAG: hypothetical protein OXG62_10250 [Nitrospinae bacterium]|nr:hypothetical protein [Nitrospinota bacterium]